MRQLTTVMATVAHASSVAAGLSAVLGAFRVAASPPADLHSAGGAATTPPMGFNSYDSYDWTINETALFSSYAANREPPTSTPLPAFV